MNSKIAISLSVSNEKETQKIAILLAELMPQGIVYLKGELGAGKTTFSQALIRAAGFQGRVKSPTYTLVEPYELAHRNIYHFDLYRLQDEEELLFIGCDEYFASATVHSSKIVHLNNTPALSLCLIEWPEKAGEILPSADIELTLEYCAQIDSQPDENLSQRKLSFVAVTPWGERVSQRISESLS